MKSKALSVLLNTIAVTLCSISAIAGNTIDQRDPIVQSDFAHLANAQRALKTAMEEIESLSGSNALPGVNKDAMYAHLASVDEFMMLVLSPERKRIETKSISGKSFFFKPVDYKDLHHVTN